MDVFKSYSSGILDIYSFWDQVGRETMASLLFIAFRSRDFRYLVLLAITGS